MTDKEEDKNHGFLSAQQLLQAKGISNAAWDDWEQSETALPRTGKKHFEPTGTWLENMQLENGLKSRKKVIEIERVARNSQLAIAEWLPGTQKAKVIKKSGQKWDNFGTPDRDNLYLLPEETLMLLEMNTLEVLWNGMPLSIQQAYEVMINSENSKCTLDEYRVYSQLVKCGYKLQRLQDKSALDNKFSNTPKRIIMNPEGLWTPNTSPTMDKEGLEGSSTTSKTNNGNDDVVPISNVEQSENHKSPKRLGIVSEETVLGNIKIIKNTSPPATVTSNGSSPSKWSGSRIQRNVKLMPKRTEKAKNATEIISKLIELPSFSNQKRQSELMENPVSKKSRPEVIELSDDEIEEIPRPMTRMEMLNTFPNMAHPITDIIVEVHRAYLPPGVKPSRDIYHFSRSALMNLAQTDSMLRSNVEVIPEVNNVRNGHFYSQGSSQCQAITTYNSNNGYSSYRGMRCQRDGNSYIEQNVSHNTIHNPLSGIVLQSNYCNLVLDMMGSMVRSFRQQQFQQTTFCPNMPMFPHRFSQPHALQRMQPYPMSYDSISAARDQYYRRGGGGVMPSTSYQRGRGYRSMTNDSQRQYSEELVFQPAFTKRPGTGSWADLKKKWREETTITIEDEEPMQVDVLEDNSEIQVVETISPLISSKNGISSMAEVYERLRIIKSATERTVRSRKVDYSLSYEVFPAKQTFRKSAPGEPICRLYVINSKKESLIDASKLQRLQQDSKDVPVVVAYVSQSCISYIQLGSVHLPNLS